MEVDDIDSTQQPATAVTTGTITAVTTRGGFGSSSRQQWPHSSRIIRVSRASGGKDRHSKVWTAKGPRDRRVRLSVNTAIQFYDLQDRLGYDQPSKAVEWLIKAAAEAINELPCLDSSNFPAEVSRTGTGDFMTELPNCLETTLSNQQKKQQVQVGSVSKSGCSSNNSDTSKGSGLSLSRSEIRVKARERARERTTAAKEKEESSEPPPQPPPALSRVSVASIGSGGGGGGQSSSFTQLLTAGIDKASSTSGPGTTSYHNNGGNNNIPMVADYFGSGFMGLAGNRFGNAPLPHVMSLLPFTGSHEIQHQHQHQHQHQQSLSFLADQHHQNQNQNQNHGLVHQVPNTTTTTTSTGGGGGVSSDYNLNFSISSTSNGFNRGTLQSNSTSTSSPPPSFLSYLSGSSVPFFLGGAPISPVVVENQQHHHHVHHYHHDQNHHQFNPAELQLCYGDGTGGRHSDHKGKGKN